MTPKRCQYDYLLRHMDATIKLLLCFSPIEVQGQTDLYKRQLCIAIATAVRSEDILAYLENGPYPDSAQVNEDMARTDGTGVLAAAAAVGCLPALAFFVDRVDRVASVENSSELHGTPLLAAASNSQDIAAEFIFERHQVDTDAGGQYAWSTLKMCMQKRRVALLPQLFEWFCNGGPMDPKIRSRKRSACVRWALKTDNVDFLLQCAPNYGQSHVSKTNRCGLWHPNFRRACENGNSGMVKWYLDNGTPCLCRHDSGSSHLAKGLKLATASRWLLASKLSFDNGTDVNYTMNDYKDTLEPPICWAVKALNVDLVVLLLARGAMIPLHGFSGRNSITRALTKARGGMMLRVLRQAIEQREKVTE
jgi:hypothetical protein